MTRVDVLVTRFDTTKLSVITPSSENFAQNETMLVSSGLRSRTYFKLKVQFSPTGRTFLNDSCKFISKCNLLWHFLFNIVSGFSTVPQSHNGPLVYVILKIVMVVHFMSNSSNLKVLLKGSHRVALTRDSACSVQSLPPRIS